jgi:DNA helicase-2/ATP-dependent DNA helicase PcrA
LLCPACGKPLTVGVQHRVDDLADRPMGYTPDTIPFKSIVPLQEVIAETLGVGKSSKKVQAQYHQMIARGGTEFGILLDVPIEEIAKFSNSNIARAIENIRLGKVRAVAGYDGEYGVIRALGDEKDTHPRQVPLL